MTVDDKVSEPKGKVSPFAFLLSSLAVLLATLFLANTFFILRAARLLDEVGAQSAYRAAQEQNFVAAGKAVDQVLQNYRPDGFFLREPIKSEITVYQNSNAVNKAAKKNNQTSTAVPAPFATVRTSLVAWIPAPQLFAGTFEKLKVSHTNNPNLVRFTALHSSPCLTLYDEIQKSGRTSI
ncbi:MAG: hypothetical protein IT342_15700 [Candidatus Melainabacteria bacterium]|nr:hypothetical protein [Candidatus Melainabacteria bacterium]